MCGPAVDPGSWTFIDRYPPDTHSFWTRFLYITILEMWSFDNKKSSLPSTKLLKIPPHYWKSNPQPLYRQATRATTMVLVCCVVVWYEWNFAIYRGNWLSIKFGENDSFRKLFLFFENTFQYLGGISQDISGSHFDSRRSLSSANRRQIVGDRSTWPILFVSITQPCDQHDRKIRTIRKSAARSWWRGRRARGYRKLILRVNLLYVPNIKM